MSEFKPHDYFTVNTDGYISRQIFQEHVRKTYDQIRELADYIKQYEGTIDTEFEKIVTHVTEHVTQLTDLYNDLLDNNVLDSKIQEKLTQLELNYAPKLSTLEQNDLSLTAQLQQTEQSLNAQLTQKPNRTEVYLKENGININDWDEDTRRIILDMEPGEVNAVLGIGNVKKENIARNTVTESKVAFIKKSTNLFNHSQSIEGYNIDNVTGELVEHSNFYVSDFIEIEPNTVYTHNGLPKMVYYGKDKEYIGIASASPFTTHASAEYIRVVFEKRHFLTGQLNEGETLLPYEPYYLKINGLLVDGKNIIDHSIGLETLNFIGKSTNLFDHSQSVEGYNVDNSTGELVENSKFNVTKFIKVEPNTVYTHNGLPKMVFYDKDKEYISIASSLTFTTHAKAEYMRIVFENRDVHVRQLNKGEVLLDYEPFYFTLDGFPLGGNTENEEEVSYNFRLEDRYVIEGSLDGIYNSPIIDEPDDLLNMQANEMFALYDDLGSRFSDYISKEIWDQDGLGNNIYKYTFRPTPVPNVSQETKFPKVLIVAGVHGGEKAGVYSLYQVLTALCENWKQDENLETLRWNVQFEVIPIVNIDGFNRNDRKNENGIDLARNFPVGFTVGTDTTARTYGGTEPLSEGGSQAVARLVEENTDAIYFGSFHNFSGAAANDDYFIWNPATTQLQKNLGKRLISKMSRKWKDDYDWLPQDESTYFGYSDGAVPQASESLYAESLGIQASTFEISDRFLLEPNWKTFSSLSLTMGVEAHVNWLMLVVKNNTEFYNNYKK